MTIKRTLANLLVAGAMLTPVAIKAEEKNVQNNTVKRIAESETISMPSWIPTTADGKFDKQGATQQFETIWNKNGKDFQEYLDKVKEGIPEDVACTHLANKLANGDKRQEEQFLLLHDTIKSLQQKKQDMLSTCQRQAMHASALMLFSSLSLLGISYNRKKMGKLNLALAWIAFICCTGATIYANVNLYKSDKAHLKDAFVNLQKTAYTEYKQQIENPKKYKMAEIQQAQQKIQKGR